MQSLKSKVCGDLGTTMNTAHCDVIACIQTARALLSQLKAGEVERPDANLPCAEISCCLCLFSASWEVSQPWGFVSGLYSFRLQVGR